jgi:LPXTG-motif cell wall-anchored protein
METAHAEYGGAVITHGFPNMTYKNTQSIKSDPEITVFHDRVTGNTNLALIAATGVIVAVAAIGAVVFMRKRKKK